ncbi:MAG: hypothetical protein Q6367_009040 [Candidatus Freyarchaeota archaeon]
MFQLPSISPLGDVDCSFHASSIGLQIPREAVKIPLLRGERQFYIALL